MRSSTIAPLQRSTARLPRAPESASERWTRDAVERHHHWWQVSYSTRVAPLGRANAGPCTPARNWRQHRLRGSGFHSLLMARRWFSMTSILFKTNDELFRLRRGRNATQNSTNGSRFRQIKGSRAERGRNFDACPGNVCNYLPESRM